MFGIERLFKSNPTKESLLARKDEMARILKTSPKALAAFEASYQKDGIDSHEEGDIFQTNSRQASALIKRGTADLDDIINRIVDSLVAQTRVLTIKNGKAETTLYTEPASEPVTREELMAIPEMDRPWLTGELMKSDMPGQSAPALCWHWDSYLKAKDSKIKKMHYDHFRQGLDILDLDAVTYAMIGTNPNSMGNWLPQIADAAKKQGFFKVPETTVIQVPITLLQLTRQPFEAMNATTMAIVDRYCMKVFGLDTNKEYFIKTGTYSSKFDFRNCHVHGEKEVRELGEYLLYIHYQALQMANPLVMPTIYGVSTTNEWVVREFIPDKESRPCIYKGMPLRTEFRLFVDFDTKEILGINPYWDPKVMKQRFGHSSDADTKHNVHDYIIYSTFEETLMADYETNKQLILNKTDELVASTEGLSGQWSLDIMKDGNDFYLIDMALAANSAMKECIPKDKLKAVNEDWMPKISTEK